jgi:hypothetical protein
MIRTIEDMRELAAQAKDGKYMGCTCQQTKDLAADVLTLCERNEKFKREKAELICILKNAEALIKSLSCGHKLTEYSAGILNSISNTIEAQLKANNSAAGT